MTRTGLQMLRLSVPDVSAAKFNHNGEIAADRIAALFKSPRYLALFFPLIPFDMSVVENARGHTMRAALIALMLMLSSPVGLRPRMQLSLLGGLGHTANLEP